MYVCKITAGFGRHGCQWVNIKLHKIMILNIVASQNVPKNLYITTEFNKLAGGKYNDLFSLLRESQRVLKADSNSLYSLTGE